MKLCNFMTGGGIHAGVLTERGVLDLTEAGIASCVNEIIAGGMLGRIAEYIKKGAPGLDPDALEYANVTQPEKIACVGLNYKNHAEETGGEAPKEPVFFAKYNDTLAPDGAEVPLPRWQRCFDYEAELVIVIGKPVWNVTAERAAEYIFGYTCGNDLSARDCQFKSGQWLIGKSFPRFGPAGPFIVTADSFAPEAGHELTCSLNGKTVQRASTADMIFSCPEIVAWASRYFPLAPGDLIFTGTPDGVILGHKKGTRVWLKPGDRLRVEIEGVCALENLLV